MNPKGEQLAAGKKHECKLHGMDVGEVQSIGVRSDQSGLGAKWKLQQVRLRWWLLPVMTELSRADKRLGLRQVEVRKPDGTLFTFPFDSWVEGKEAIQISEARHALAPASEEPQRFKLVAWTSDIQFAGTDSNVYLELWGNEGNASGKSAVHLNNRTNNFERGTCHPALAAMTNSLALALAVLCWNLADAITRRMSRDRNQRGYVLYRTGGRVLLRLPPRETNRASASEGGPVEDRRHVLGRLAPRQLHPQRHVKQQNIQV